MTERQTVRSRNIGMHTDGVSNVVDVGNSLKRSIQTDGRGTKVQVGGWYEAPDHCSMQVLASRPCLG